MKKTDIIIIGQGIAGSVLALELLRGGKNILVIDDPALSNCSKAAAGIYNPIVFKRLTQSWMAETVLPAMLDLYSDLEAKFKTRLLYPVQIERILANKDEEGLWKKKSANELSEFIGEISADPVTKTSVGLVKQSGYVDIPKFLEASRNYFEGLNVFVLEKFDHEEVKFDRDHLTYRNISCNKIIFCEGPLYKNNPWFGNLNFKPAKGEVLTIHCKELVLDHILNKDIFILPLGKKGYFKVGATYDWDDLTDKVTAAGRMKLEEKLQKLIPYKYEVIDQQAGVRPSTIDRRPVIGFHGEHKNLGIFNGFGTKAVMLAPYFAKHFCSFIENKTSLLEEIKPSRPLIQKEKL